MQSNVKIPLSCQLSIGYISRECRSHTKPWAIALWSLKFWLFVTTLLSPLALFLLTLKSSSLLTARGGQVGKKVSVKILQAHPLTINWELDPFTQTLEWVTAWWGWGTHSHPTRQNILPTAIWGSLKFIQETQPFIPSLAESLALQMSI